MGVAGAQEPEVDLATRRIRPARSDRLNTRMTNERLGSTDLAFGKRTLFSTTKIVALRRHGYRHIDADHARFHIVCIALGCASIAGKMATPFASG